MSTKVYVLEVADRSTYLLKYRHPITGKTIRVSSGIKVGRGQITKARAAAAALAEQIDMGVEGNDSDPTVQEFVDRYEAEALPGLAPATGADS
jgi:hypothetical protein